MSRLIIIPPTHKALYAATTTVADLDDYLSKLDAIRKNVQEARREIINRQETNGTRNIGRA